ncbi:glycoside-pentoside-hexuronide (GPH):cation symporter [Ligilactobacillus ruminis]|uniref:glycoside-pentoside-hexuronide (GPH):cation symporter n=1 Tax=Ligilactobacillus ruminis TaxID=1623 RepID=UPI00147641B1|nr:glycoside-pentoside-hexuronide (GPH):cation symporter [Ligilactobacillus ruminis]NME33062.1 MFS transporter [Ligilactobacillus ruminis]WKB70971.1 glycoside-pentoside-hexuronide (GPH):cation symporter [Ligilactobacillus ruminis]
MSNEGKTKMSMGQRLAYSFGAFGNDAFYGLLSGYLIMFITSHLFNSGNQAVDNKMISLVTMIIMVLRIVELFIDPFIGNAIDRTKTRWGHFRPWVVAGGTVSAVLLLCLFTSLGNLYQKNAMLYLVIFAVMYITMDIFYSFKDVGFWSMLPSLTTDSREREKTATFARFGSTIGGGLVGVLVMPAVIYFSEKTTSTGDAHGWFMFALIICTIALVSAWVVGCCTREVNSEIRENKEDTVGVIGVFKAVAKNDQLLWVAFAYLFYGIGVNILGALEVYYFTYIMGQPKSFSILSTINIFLGMVSAALFPVLSKKFSRKTVFGGCLVFMLCGIGVFALAGNNLALVLLAAVMFAFPQQMVFLVVLMIITDSVEYGQWKSGHRDESLSLSIRPLIDKFGGAVSNGVVGQIAILAGMTTGATASSITAAGRMNFKLMMFAVPAVMLMVSIIIFMKKITLTEERHAQIVAELEKTWGKDLGISVKNTSSDEKFSVKAPVSGNLIELSEVNDDVFSKGQAGLGFAIRPNDGRVYAPFDATVRQVFSTRHAVGIVADNGMALLIHVGLGTVALKGTGFVTYVEEGQRISQGDEILEFWDDTIRKAGLDDTVIVTVTNSDNFEDFTLKQKSGAEIKAMDDAMELRVKKGEAK